MPPTTPPESNLNLICICLCCVGFFDKDNERRGSIMDFWGGRSGGGRGNKKIANVNHEEGRMMIIAAGGSGRTDGWMVVMRRNRIRVLW
jgi:hypothetical protein